MDIQQMYQQLGISPSVYAFGQQILEDHKDTEAAKDAQKALDAQKTDGEDAEDGGDSSEDGAEDGSQGET